IYNSTGGTGTEKFRISTAGNVGIGISPLDKLHIYGDIRVGTGYTGCVKDADGTVIAGTCSSDRRMKTIIHPFPQLLDKLVRLTPVHFSWKSAEYPELHLGTSQSFGLIAQEVEKVFPQLVTQDSQGWKAVKYNQLPFLMLQGIRELRAENDNVKEQMKSQQVQMRALEAELAEAKQILRLVQAQLLPGQRVVEIAGGSAR
ncbi:MAG: tail fiber domain-containing protein, partial [Acidobacteriia bacterium]|nr:tail fiber domain-containing protein [Terriglobia bacterium]